jgi:hypothetical protein
MIYPWGMHGQQLAYTPAPPPQRRDLIEHGANLIGWALVNKHGRRQRKLQAARTLPDIQKAVAQS